MLEGGREVGLSEAHQRTVCFGVDENLLTMDWLFSQVISILLIPNTGTSFMDSNRLTATLEEYNIHVQVTWQARG